MSKRLWRDSQGQVWIVSHEAVVSSRTGASMWAEPSLELRLELPMKFTFQVPEAERRLPELIPDEELESLVQDQYYGASGA